MIQTIISLALVLSAIAAPADRSPVLEQSAGLAEIFSADDDAIGSVRGTTHGGVVVDLVEAGPGLVAMFVGLVPVGTVATSDALEGLADMDTHSATAGTTSCFAAVVNIGFGAGTYMIFPKTILGIGWTPESAAAHYHALRSSFIAQGNMPVSMAFCSEGAWNP